MLKVEIDKASLKTLNAKLDPIHHKIAIVWALNNVADDMLKNIQNRMDSTFDRPTRFAKNSLMVWRATKSKPEATVIEKPSVGARHFLKVQETGGPRPQTALERLLSYRLSYAGVIHSVIPASDALLDAHGNWSIGERNRALSAVRAQSDRQMNSSKFSKVKAKNRTQFFVPRPGSKLSPGIWKRTSAGAELQKVLHISESVPRYEPRLRFGDTAEDVWRDTLPGHLSAAIAKAIATAR